MNPNLIKLESLNQQVETQTPKFEGSQLIEQFMTLDQVEKVLQNIGSQANDFMHID